MNSTRLPGKALLELGGEKIYRKVYNRVKKAVDKTVMAFPESEKDEWLEQDLSDMEYYFGDDTNLLKRYYQGLQIYQGYDTLVRVTADCPYIDGQMISDFLKVVNVFGLMKQTDLWLYGGNIQGLNFEVYDRGIFEMVVKNEYYTDEQMEHVTECFTSDEEEDFVEYSLFFPANTNEKIRLTIDYPEDYEMMKILSDYRMDLLAFSTEEIIKLYKTKPEIFKINEARY